MTPPDTPYSASFDLGLVPERGSEVVLAPSEGQRQAISRWLGIEALEALKATVQISREGDDSYACTGTFEADVVQACVVTLEPVRAHLSGEYRRLYRVLPRSPARRKKPVLEARGVEISVGDEDEPELLDSPVLDLAAPLLEEVSLALNPYPRAPGVSFEPPAEEAEPEDNPFAVLKQLKTAETGPSIVPKPETAVVLTPKRRS
ncbi:MAG TPA: DUF177 domain-containing protein [Micropepsaceae bacterium]|nr:DUF177 domain-containing protein [Micropepsaceae bacterium]